MGSSSPAEMATHLSSAFTSKMTNFFKKVIRRALAGHYLHMLTFRKTPGNMAIAAMFLISAPYCKLLRRGTVLPIMRILEYKSDADLEQAVGQWLGYKVREAGYVQIAVSYLSLVCSFPPFFQVIAPSP